MWLRQTLDPAFVIMAWCAACALTITAGCATVEVVGPEHLHDQQFAPGTKPVAHIYADNWGWYLFKYIPLVTGNLDDPGMPQLPNFFTDNVRVDLLVDKVTEESQKLGASVVTDLRVRDRSEYEAFTLILWLNEFEVSANVSRPDKEGELPRTVPKAE